MVEIAYFSHHEKEKYYFIFRLVIPDFDHDKQYKFIVRDNETVQNLIDKIVCTVEKSLKPDNETSVKVSKSEIQFLQNGEELMCGINFKQFSELTSNLEFTLIGNNFQILINAPVILKLELPKLLCVDFPVYVTICDALHVQQKNSEYIWYKSLKNYANWSLIGNGFSYTPKSDDLNHYIKLSVTPKFDQKVGEPFSVVSSNPVTVFDKICPFENRALHTKNKLLGNSFRVVSYNILSEQYAKQNRYPYCPNFALDINYRKILISKELIAYKADIICLQEVDYKVYKAFYREELVKQKYKSIFDPKTSQPEGLTIFYNPEKFTLLQKFRINIGQEIQKTKLWHKIESNKLVATKVTSQNTIFQCASFGSVASTNKIVLVGNTHLFYHPTARHVRLLQVEACLKCMNRFKNQLIKKNPDYKVVFVFCGDFNSLPDSGVYQLLTKKKVSATCPDWSIIPEEKLNIELQFDKNMKSAYGTPKYTNFTDDFKGCLDYIFYETKLQMLQTVPLLTIDEFQRYIALPSQVVPSDHVALIADFKFK